MSDSAVKSLLPLQLRLAFAGLAMALMNPLLIAQDWKTVPLGGGGFVTGLVSDPSGSAIYCRTDVGGAFRWSEEGKEWISLTDAIVPPSTAGAAPLLQTASLAVDLKKPDNLYVAVGSPYKNSPHGIFASTDKGQTWHNISAENPEILIDGNGGARADGERLAVDPNNSDLLWFGSTEGGLWKGEKSGGDWKWTQISDDALPFGKAKAGISFVACDANDGKTITYAGVSDDDAAKGGVYRSEDGAKWEKVGGAAEPKPARCVIAADGTLFVTGKDSVLKLARGGTFEAIIPEQGKRYRGIAISPKAETLYVSEVRPGTCQIWRSADQGASWTTQGTADFNRRGLDMGRQAIQPQEPDGTPTLTGYWFGNLAALWVNPKNPNEVWASDFFGVARTSHGDRMGDKTPEGQPVWQRLQKNQEETVVLDLKVPPVGPALVSGLADVGGARYENISQRPDGANGNTFRNPAGGNVTSLDFCETRPNVWVRAWATPEHGKGTGGVSLDSGATWLVFGQLDGATVTNASEGGWQGWDVAPYLADQQAKGAGAVTLILDGAGAWPSSTPAIFASKETEDQSLRPRLIINDGAQTLHPVEDSYVSNKEPHASFGSLDELMVAGNDSRRISYLKFDLTGVPAIHNARLELYRKPSSNTESLTVGVYASPDTDWHEGEAGVEDISKVTASWNKKPEAYSNKKEPHFRSPVYYAGETLLHSGRVAISSKNPNNLVWAPVNAVPHYSEDRGVTWHASTGAPKVKISGVYTDGGSLGIEGKCLASDRTNGNFYFANLGSSAHEIYISEDGGKTWVQTTKLANGSSFNMRSPQLVSAPPSPECKEGGDIWLADDGTYNKQGGGLWRSTDGGSSWNSIPEAGKVSHVTFGKSASGEGYSVFIEGLVNGERIIQRSDDYGNSWEPLNGLPSVIGITSLAGDRQNAGRVFVGTGGRGTFVYGGK